MGPQKFTAPSSAEALKLIRTRMGPDAMVISTTDIDHGVEIVAISSKDLASLSDPTLANSMAKKPASYSPNYTSNRPIGRSNLGSNSGSNSGSNFGSSFDRAIAPPSARNPFSADLPLGSLRRNPARVERADRTERSVRAPGSETFTPTSFNGAERIRRGDASVINPSNNDAFFSASASAAVSAKKKQDAIAFAEAKADAKAALNPASIANEIPVSSATATSSTLTSINTDSISTVSTLSLPAAASAPKVEQLLAEISEVKYLLQSHVAGNLWGNIQQESSHVTEIVKHLLNSGFSPKLCAQIARNLPDDFNTQQLIKNAREQVKCLIKTSQAFDLFDRGGVFAFIGPTGVGKTTTVAKIAARCVLRYGRNQVALLTTDTYRIGAQEQLKTYAKILGLSVTALRDSEDLASKIKEFSNRKIILLDTAGVSQRDTLMVEQCQLLQNGSDRAKRILVMSSTTDLRTQEEVINLHNQAMQNSHNNKLDSVIITKIDEAAHLAPVIDSVIRHDLSILFVSNGQRVPEDLSLPDINYLSHRAMAMRAFSETFSITDEQVPAILSDHLGDWIRKVNS
ncbi:flagellar biosynthesis protein FlhF [Polynucleobacter sp. AP-Sving-400A-A2]|uniref:flagellar biosynthesis protein FlhF n=1 Tax=Polynucleobacter sp. AP-Sving-400A-A2 TaxID=2081049 RepID=UPI001BFE2DA1|nr:flagellar biosynthesis protein FlhF [Polynucleobacter sp. AP-Sving-400A-A2]QWE14962.1 flagellar biosynthesis protein FlhF [Polynucleobacter sp. AP-Sving-400A-A2]